MDEAEVRAIADEQIAARFNLTQEQKDAVNKLSSKLMGKVSISEFTTADRSRILAALTQLLA